MLWNGDIEHILHVHMGPLKVNSFQHPQPLASRSPICLVHGPFGSGKSTLLVTLLRFLLKARQRAGSPLSGARILVASGTNVAVDRVLLGLLETGCTDFLRIGSLRRMDPRLLPHSLHASDSKASGLAELKQALKEGVSGSERRSLEDEIQRLEAGGMRREQYCQAR